MSYTKKVAASISMLLLLSACSVPSQRADNQILTVEQAYASSGGIGMRPYTRSIFSSSQF